MLLDLGRIDRQTGQLLQADAAFFRTYPWTHPGSADEVQIVKLFSQVEELRRCRGAR